MIAHGAKIAAYHGMQQRHPVTDPGKYLLRSKQFASVSGFHGCASFLLSSHIRSHICRAAEVEAFEQRG